MKSWELGKDNGSKGPADTNPIDRWIEDFGQAEALLSECRYDEGIGALEKLLHDMSKYQGNAADQFIPKILGLLGIGYFRQGQTEKGLEVTRQAYDLCKEAGDVEGADIYQANLEEMRRQLRHSQIDETAIIFRDSQGRVLRYKDLKGFTGPVRWEIVGRENIPSRAEELHQTGREAGQQGEYEKALELFSQAAKLAPAWPYPIYDAAFTYLLNGDYDRALEYYERVDELAPRGFFTSNTAVHTLRQEKNGRLPQGTYSFYMNLEWEFDPDRKRQIIDRLLERCPDFAPAWKEKVNFAESDEERLQFIARGLGCSPDADTQGILLINEAAILDRQGQRQEAIEILARVALDANVTLQNEHLAKSFLANLI